MVDKIFPLGDGVGFIELIDHMGGDLSVVNDAKVSFNKQSDQFGKKSRKLLNYLLKHKHYSPLRGTVLKFRVKAPLFIARQWWKHTVASTVIEDQNGWNEQSGRYVEFEPEFYIPGTFRKQSTSNKQGSEGELDDTQNEIAVITYRRAIEAAYSNYQHLISAGVAREQARGILPTTLYTSWIWTASLQAVLHFLDLRNTGDAQKEIALYAQAIEELIRTIIPETAEAWRKTKQ